MLVENSGTGMTMPVVPMYGNGGNGNNDGIGDGWWIILLLLAMNGWGNNNGCFGGGNGGGTGAIWPYFTAQNTDSQVRTGFDTAALSGQLSAIQAGQSAAEVSACGRAMDQMKATYDAQIAGMNQRFGDTLALQGNLNGINNSLQNCCCENRAGIADLKYTVATEACADRQNSTNNTRDIIDTINNKVQTVMDKLCQLELDGVKAQVAQKDDIIAQLRSEAMYAKGEASRLANADNIVDSIYNRLNNCPVGTTPVYGRTPIFTCNQNGCGCNGSF